MATMVTTIRIKAFTALVVNHLAHHHGQATFSDASVRRLARRLAPATITELAAVMRADSNGRPPLTSPETHARIDELVPPGKKDLHGDFGAYCYVGFRHSLCHGWASGPTA